jgi:DNA-binding phage protein
MSSLRHTDEVFTRWDPVERLTTAADQVAYLKASFMEDPGDGSLILAAIDDIARARVARGGLIAG